MSVLYQVHKAYAVLWAGNLFVGSEIPKRNDVDEFWKLKFHSEHFPRNARFLSFDGPSNYFYLLKNQGSVCHPTSKLLKYDLVQTWNTFQNPA